MTSSFSELDWQRLPGEHPAAIIIQWRLVMSRHYANRSLACLVLLAGLTAGSAKADVVTDWNSVVMDAGTAAREIQVSQARSVTMVHVAMFEAINAIEQRYKPYV